MRRFIALAAALVAAPVCAQPPERGFYVGAEMAGQDIHAGRDYGIRASAAPQPGPGPIVRVYPESATVSGVDASWSATAGYRVNRYVAFELAYADFGSLVVTETYDLSFIPGAPPEYVAPTHYEASGVSLSVLGSIPLGERFEAYFRVGVLHADQELMTFRAILPGQSPVEKVSDDVPLIGLGVSWHLTPAWSLRLELQAIDDLHGGDELGVDAVGPLRIRRYGVGATYAF